jgi:hypothetical protein
MQFVDLILGFLRGLENTLLRRAGRHCEQRPFQGGACCHVLFVTILLIAIAQIATAHAVPLPRERPPTADEQLSAPEWSACDQRLTDLAQFEPRPPIRGPGECTANDVVVLDAVRLPNGEQTRIAPAATLRCPMAEAVAHWVREDVAAAIATLGTRLRSVETAESFDCRGRNGVAGAKISEHGRANALDVRSLKLTNGTAIELTNAHESKSLRERFRNSACARFPTVLGNGADAYHETHVHLDLIERSHNYRICQWDVLDEAEAAARAAAKAAQAPQTLNSDSETESIPLPRPRPRTRG